MWFALDAESVGAHESRVGPGMVRATAPARFLVSRASQHRLGYAVSDTALSSAHGGRSAAASAVMGTNAIGTSVVIRMKRVISVLLSMSGCEKNESRSDAENE